jgi:toxin ParE1/3/4
VTSNFVVRPEAEADIEEAYAWYESRSLSLGDRFLGAVGETIALLQEVPQRFPEKHREPDFSIRRALVDAFPYSAFFIWDEERTLPVSSPACTHVEICVAGFSVRDG